MDVSAGSAERSKTITAVERAADVLSFFAESDDQTLGVTEIARELGLSKAVVHRILGSLRSRDFVQLDESTRRYKLGPSALAVGMRYMEQVELRELARGAMRRLVERTSETATLSIRNGWHRIYVDQIQPNREVKMTVQLGVAFPLHAGGSSKAFLAFMGDAAVDDYLETQPLSNLTEATITDPDALRCELAAVRANGFATSLGERQAGAGSVAAPVLDHSGHPVAVLSVCGPVERFRAGRDHIAVALLEETRNLSRQLGFNDTMDEGPRDGSA